MTEQTVETVVALPGGGVAITMPSGELADPVHVTAKTLTRMGQAEFDAVLGWVLSERARVQSRTVASSISRLKR